LIVTGQEWIGNTLLELSAPSLEGSPALRAFLEEVSHRHGSEVPGVPFAPVDGPQELDAQVLIVHVLSPSLLGADGPRQ